MDKDQLNEWNRQVIEEFRANGGVVGGNFAGVPVLLLHHVGAKSGIARVAPLVYMADGDDLVIFASKAGAPTNPDWYHNLVAHPDVTVEVGTVTVPMRARVAQGEERDALFDRHAERFPTFRQYQEGTDRVIPVVVLERRAA